MVERIRENKDRVLEYMDRELGKYGSDKMDVAAIEKLSDIVKDLAEAEEACWEAEYYRSVTESMDKGSMGYGMGYDGMPQNYRRGYRGQPRDSMGRYSSRGYSGHDDVMMEMRQMMEHADPQEKERLRQQLRQMADM